MKITNIVSIARSTHNNDNYVIALKMLLRKGNFTVTFPLVVEFQ